MRNRTFFSLKKAVLKIIFKNIPEDRRGLLSAPTFIFFTSLGSQQTLKNNQQATIA